MARTEKSNKTFAKNTVNLLFQIAICAFLGIFTLFLFETTAYQYGHAANVVVVLMAAAAVSSLLGGAYIIVRAIEGFRHCWHLFCRIWRIYHFLVGL